MKPFQKRMFLSILIIIDLHLLVVQSYNSPPKFNLKVRDTPIVDKVYTNCSNFRTLVRSEESGNIVAGCKNALLELELDLTVIKKLDFNVCGPPAGDITCEQEKRYDFEYYCHNYIRTIVELQHDDPNGKYFVCGTNALRPLCYYVTKNFTRDPRNPTVDCEVNNQDIAAGLYSGVELGAFNPDQNISSILVSAGPGEWRLYTSTSFNSAETQPMIRRSNMLDVADGTEVIIDKGYPKWLDTPQFVGKPIEFNDRIYFFFRENAKEFENAGTAVFSRVAALCKNDTGGKQATSLAGMWTTYIKARLNCSLQGEYPFYYDHLQDIYQSPSDPSIIYAVFTTQEYGQPGSALCVYNMEEIEHLIEQGDLKGQESPNSLWLPYSNSKPPIDPRTGSCSSVQPEGNYDNIRSYSLVDYPVPNLADYRESTPLTVNRESDDPLLIQNDVRFLQLVVVNELSFDMFYIGTDHGTLIKFLMPENGDGILSQEINLEVMEPVLTMEVWSDWIFFGSETAIQRVPLDHCDGYTTEFQKCLTKDPHCQSEGANPEECKVTPNEVIGPEDVTADPSDVIYLFCHATVEEGFALMLEWFLNGKSLTNGEEFDNEHLLQGEITYDYQYGKKIENEVRSYLRVFVNAMTVGEYTCRIYGDGFEWDRKGSIKMNDLYVTIKSYELRKEEVKRLEKLSNDTKKQYENNQQCAISSTELCEDITEMDLDKGFTDSNPYIGMNKIKNDVSTAT